MVDKARVRRSYDALASTFDEHRSAEGRGTEILASFLEDLDPGSRILDVGCGTGVPILASLAANHAAIGLDIAGEPIRLAQERVPAAELLQGDMVSLPIATDACDAVVAFWSLIHVPLAEHQPALEEFARIIRPGGRALLCEGTDAWTGENPNWLDTDVPMEWNIAGAEKTAVQLQTAGFEITDRWGAPEELTPSDESTVAEAHPWTFFAAILKRE